MKQAFFKKAIVSACAAIVTLSMSAPVFAESFIDYTTYANHNVSKLENAYVHQEVPNSNNPGTYVVLNSKYEKTTDKFSLSGIYGAAVFTVKVDGSTYYPNIRFARVQATDANGEVIASNQVQNTEVNNTTASAQVYNKAYDSSLQRATFYGYCGLNLYGRTYTYYTMNCILNY